MGDGTEANPGLGLAGLGAGGGQGERLPAALQAGAVLAQQQTRIGIDPRHPIDRPFEGVTISASSPGVVFEDLFILGDVKRVEID